MTRRKLRYEETARWRPGKAPDDPKGAMQSKRQRTPLAQVILPLKVNVESRWTGKQKAKERLVFSWAYRNEREVLIGIVPVDLCETPSTEHLYTTIRFAYSRFWV